jgi:hypothetical protein
MEKKKLFAGAEEELDLSICNRRVQCKMAHCVTTISCSIMTVFCYRQKWAECCVWFSVTTAIHCGTGECELLDKVVTFCGIQ